MFLLAGKTYHVADRFYTFYMNRVHISIFLSSSWTVLKLVPFSCCQGLSSTVVGLCKRWFPYWNSQCVWLRWKVPETFGDYKCFVWRRKYHSWLVEASRFEICIFQLQEIQGFWWIVFRLFSVKILLNDFSWSLQVNRRAHSWMLFNALFR